MSIPRDNFDFEQCIKESKYLRVRDEQTDNGHLVEFFEHDKTIFGFTRKGAMCTSSKTAEDAVRKAEQLANAQDLLTFTGGSGEGFLQHDLDIQFKIASPQKVFRKDGSDSAREGQHALIRLHNKGTETLYVSVFSINVWGGIHHINRTRPFGICLLPDRKREIGQNLGFPPESGKGLGMLWPEGLPRDRPVPETMVFIITKEEFSFRGFARPQEWLPPGTTLAVRELEDRPSFSISRVVPYDVQRISWTLDPRLQTARSQPERTSASAVTINGNWVNLNRSFPNNLFSEAGSSESSEYILVHTNENLRKAKLKELDAMDATLKERIDNRLYLFHCKPGDIRKIRQKDYIVDAVVYPKRAKIGLALQKIGRGDPESVRDIIVALHENEDHNIDSIVAELERIAGPGKPYLIQNQEKIQMSVQAATVFDLAALDGVRAVQEVLNKVCFNNRARHTMKARIAYNNTSFNGNNQTVAVADSGLDNGDINNIHPAFQGRVAELIPIRRPGDAADSCGHGTHVCGSILGDIIPGANNVTHQGVARQARLVLQAVGDDEGHIYPGSLTELFLDPYQRHGTRIHNNSWGTDWTEEQLRYDEYSRDIDRFVWEHDDLLICFAAGNDGETDPTLGAEAAAKNCLTVGAMDSGPLETRDVGRRLRGPDGICLTSNHGPTLEGRIKPDVVAPGEYIFSTRSRSIDNEKVAAHETSADGYFMELSGTSMATALVSGCAAVLREVLISSGFQNPSAALMKALLINGADSFNEADLWTEGFGRINLKNSVAHVRETDTAGFLEGDPLHEDDYHTFSLPDDMPNHNQDMTLKVTMTYTDKEQPGLFNNLNLIVMAPDGTERHGNMGTDNGFDDDNNVEQVVWKGIPPGYVEITVCAESISGTNRNAPRERQPTQSFALAWRIFH